ncbi:hypothetical protein ACFFKE_08460 [Streptomyces mutabilis]|uniref:hypothetical protein n=1 Tax=Streptomyces mutabilis TaxID=67332 RepID=UPI001780CE77|nr:hypothetical protein [Streptomyces mutabilis]GGQ47857.1 hypothetical protein GCM10010279_66870 [Streptomyces mutabilis]
MSDPLYRRYQDGLDAYRQHTCTPPECTLSARCAEGQRLWDQFTRAQDAYLKRQRSQQPT